MDGSENKKRATRLHHFSIKRDLKERHLPLLAEALVLFNNQRLRALSVFNNLPADVRVHYTHPLPLTKIYKLLNVAPRDRCIIIYAAMTFFVRAFRGNSVSRRCSGWRIKKRSSVNKKLLDLLKHLYKSHEEYFRQVTQIITTKASDKTVQVEVTATFELTSDQSSELMQIVQIITENEKETDDATEVRL